MLTELEKIFLAKGIKKLNGIKTPAKFTWQQSCNKHANVIKKLNTSSNNFSQCQLTELQQQF